MPPLKRRWTFPAGAGLGLALALLVGTMLDGELQPLRYLFVPLSALAGGVAALVAWTHFGGLAETARDAVRKWRLRISLAILALGSILLLGLYLKFSERVHYGEGRNGEGRNGGSVAYLVGWTRSGLCECSGDDASCIQEMGIVPEKIGACWTNRWIVQLVMTLSYLLILASAGRSRAC